MKRSDFMTHLGVWIFTVLVGIPILYHFSFDLNEEVFFGGLIAFAAVLVLCAKSAFKRNEISYSLKDWLLKKGILYALTQAPIVAIIFGFFFKVTSFEVMDFGVLLSFVLLPIWIVYRKNRSTDPDEPVHHLVRYGTYALWPYLAFSITRIPAYYLWGMPYWHPWFDFGHTLTHQPLNTLGTLFLGACLYSLQGYSLGLGFYVLFSRHSLSNAVLYLCVFLSTLYSLVFPLFGRIGVPTPFLWHVVSWVAHLAMALTAWGMPYLLNLKLRNRFHVILRPAFLVCVFLLPYSFAFWRSESWQFPKQEAFEQSKAHDATWISLDPVLSVTQDPLENKYSFQVKVGPRIFENYFRKKMLIDLENIDIGARIYDGSNIIAWCHSHFSDLPRPQEILGASGYQQGLIELNTVDLQIHCEGDPIGQFSSRSLDVDWSLSATYIGERNSYPIKKNHREKLTLIERSKEIVATII